MSVFDKVVWLPPGAEDKELNVEDIIPCPLLPKRTDLGDIDSLAESIRQVELIQPIVVMKSPRVQEKYELIAGERRLEACKRMGKVAVKCKVHPENLDFDNIFRIAFHTNEQRKDNTAYEKGLLYKAWFDEWKKKTGEESLSKFAEYIGKSKSLVSHHLHIVDFIEKRKAEGKPYNMLYGLSAHIFWEIFKLNKYPALQEKVIDMLSNNPLMKHGELESYIDTKIKELEAFPEEAKPFAEEKIAHVEPKVAQKMAFMMTKHIKEKIEEAKATGISEDEIREIAKREVDEAERVCRKRWEAEKVYTTISFKVNPRAMLWLKRYAEAFGKKDVNAFVRFAVCRFMERYPLPHSEEFFEEEKKLIERYKAKLGIEFEREI